VGIAQVLLASNLYPMALASVRYIVDSGGEAESREVMSDPKIALTQSLAALGSVLALIFGARDYDRRCVSSYFAYSKPDTDEVSFVMLKFDGSYKLNIAEMSLATLSSSALLSVALVVKNTILTLRLAVYAKRAARAGSSEPVEEEFIKHPLEKCARIVGHVLDTPRRLLTSLESFMSKAKEPNEVSISVNDVITPTEVNTRGEKGNSNIANHGLAVGARQRVHETTGVLLNRRHISARNLEDNRTPKLMRTHYDIKYKNNAVIRQWNKLQVFLLQAFNLFELQCLIDGGRRYDPFDKKTYDPSILDHKKDLALPLNSKELWEAVTQSTLMAIMCLTTVTMISFYLTMVLLAIIWTGPILPVSLCLIIVVFWGLLPVIDAFRAILLRVAIGEEANLRTVRWVSIIIVIIRASRVAMFGSMLTTQVSHKDAMKLVYQSYFTTSNEVQYLTDMITFDVWSFFDFSVAGVSKAFTTVVLGTEAISQILSSKAETSSIDALSRAWAVSDLLSDSKGLVNFALNAVISLVTGLITNCSRLVFLLIVVLQAVFGAIFGVLLFLALLSKYVYELIKVLCYVAFYISYLATHKCKRPQTRLADIIKN
jgi:hypothetical protein